MWGSLAVLFVLFVLIHPVAERARRFDYAPRGATAKIYPVPKVSIRNKQATRI